MQRIATLFAGDVLQIDVVEIGPVGTVFHTPVGEFHTEDSKVNGTHRDVTGVNIMHLTATLGIGFDADNTTQFRTVHRAILHPNVMAAARDFATNGHTRMSVFHVAVAHDDVLTWNDHASSVLVSS